MKVEFYRSDKTDPYFNLAAEALLFEHCPQNTLRFYLWQNAHTVVIGKNQHAPSEVFLERLRADGGTLARRTSGGGAVYHDLGNLNFTFIARSNLFSIPSQMEMIASALRSLGVNAQVNGRNDIEIDGAKVSGNAFLHQGDRHLHHGTLLVNVDKTKLGLYLNVHPKKLQRKQVSSVASRIVNLSELIPIDIPSLEDTLFKAVEAYTLTKGEFHPLLLEDIAHKQSFLASEDWLYGSGQEEKLWLDTCIETGCFRWMFHVRDGVIVSNHLYTDMMDTEFPTLLQDAVNGSRATLKDILSCLTALNEHEPHPVTQALIQELSSQSEETL